MTVLERGPAPFVGQLTDDKSIDYAISALRQGEVIGVSNTSVYALIGSLATAQAGYDLYDAKHRPAVKTVASLITEEAFGELADFDQCDQSTQQLLESPQLIRETIADIAFLRFPIKESVASAMSPATQQMLISRRDSAPGGVPFIQGFVSAADTEFNRLERAIQKNRLPYPVITSMNQSGKPEITHPDEAEAFCAKANIPLLDNTNGRNPISHGSFPIFEALPDGLVCVRTGNISPHIMKRIMQPVVDYSFADGSENKPHVKPLRPWHVPEVWQENLIGSAVREAVINQRLAFETSAA